MGKGKEKIPATLRNVVWVNQFGTKNEGVCFCCVIEKISKANFAVGHIKSEASGGKLHTSNLRPICTLCNSSMGRTEMYEFIKKYGLGGLKNIEAEANAKKNPPAKGNCVFL
jgi:HNH endonuclease